MSTGAPTPVVLVHGVGFGPSTFSAVARELRRAGPVVVMERRGYGTRAGSSPAATVEDHVADLVGQLDRAGFARAVVAGTSGGATVALAAALLTPERVSVAVVHEPAAGSLVPELRAQIRAALDEGGGLGLARMLAGPRTWATLPAVVRAELRASAAVIEADARAFHRWEPPIADAAGAARISCTVGQDSAPVRYAVAQRLRGATGASITVVPGSGHLAQLDAPEAFARAISTAGRVARAADDPYLSTPTQTTGSSTT